MSQYGAWLAGERITATKLSYAIWDMTVKPAVTGRASTTTLADDPDLAGMQLGVGTWHVKSVLMMTCVAASTNIKTRWSFTGTWNNPLRLTIGPAITNTAASTAITPTKFAVAATTSDATYGLAASTAYNTAYEECATVVVTVAGSMALQWAQNTSNASEARMQGGSYMQFIKIAD